MEKNLVHFFEKKFHENLNILWSSHAPESVLGKINDMQLADSLRTWYIYREGACKDIFGKIFSEIGICQSLWFKIKKKYLYYDQWYAKKYL